MVAFIYTLTRLVVIHAVIIWAFFEIKENLESNISAPKDKHYTTMRPISNLSLIKHSPSDEYFGYLILLYNTSLLTYWGDRPGWAQNDRVSKYDEGTVFSCNTNCCGKILFFSPLDKFNRVYFVSLRYGS